MGGAPLGGNVSVSYTVSDGSATAGLDYTSNASGTVTFVGAQTMQTVTIALRNDTLAEGPETFSFTLGSATAGARLGSPSTAVVTINDQDKGGVVTLGRSSYTVGESAGSLSVTLTRSGATASNASVLFTTVNGSAVNGSAIAGTDFVSVSQTVTFAFNETQTILVNWTFDAP